MKFTTKSTDYYTNAYESQHNQQWNQLEICEVESDKNSATIFCGGSVAAIDWAPVSGGLNFLAVACNNVNRGIELSLDKSTKSCVQFYEFKDLKNEK